MRKMAHAGLLLLAMVASGVFVVDAQDSPPLQVVTKTIEPFVFIDGESFSGFSIDLWAELARRLGLVGSFLWINEIKSGVKSVVGI
jgi:ABC-type amino acid transport substrate-binding protein